jgi:hypothetical protein
VSETTGGFHHDGAQMGNPFQAPDQGLDSFRVIAKGLCGVEAEQGEFQGCLADVDAREVQAGFVRCVRGFRRLFMFVIGLSHGYEIGALPPSPATTVRTCKKRMSAVRQKLSFVL